MQIYFNCEQCCVWKWLPSGSLVKIGRRFGCAVSFYEITCRNNPEDSFAYSPLWKHKISLAVHLSVCLTTQPFISFSRWSNRFEPCFFLFRATQFLAPSCTCTALHQTRAFRCWGTSGPVTRSDHCTVAGTKPCVPRPLVVRSNWICVVGGVEGPNYKYHIIAAKLVLRCFRSYSWFTQS